jgi:hypothetical protein
MEALLQSVIWPAIAGNVAWAFFTIAVQEYTSRYSGPFYERLTLLGILAAYLFLDWTRTQSLKSKLKRFYWVADVFLASTIAGLAIAAQAKQGQGQWYLLPVFIVGAIGNLTDAWVEKGMPGKWTKRFSWLGLYGFATLIMFAIETETEPWGWHLPIAVLLVVIVWALARSRTCDWPNRGAIDRDTVLAIGEVPNKKEHPETYRIWWSWAMKPGANRASNPNNCTRQTWILPRYLRQTRKLHFSAPD